MIRSLILTAILATLVIIACSTEVTKSSGGDPGPPVPPSCDYYPTQETAIESAAFVVTIPQSSGFSVCGWFSVGETHYYKLPVTDLGLGVYNLNMQLFCDVSYTPVVQVFTRNETDVYELKAQFVGAPGILNVINWGIPLTGVTFDEIILAVSHFGTGPDPAWKLIVAPQ
jgi:hypothetical protein